MAKTINHPPYEIDPWKADTTNPPSELPFSPEIVEAVEKPKQEPVPPQSTEGQQKIEESISRVDRFNNEINSLREQQEQVLQEVQAGIDETSNKIKQLNELEERIKQQVADYTEDTDRFLREAGQLKGELEEAQGKMDKAITDASSAITAAESAQNALEAYKNGEKARLEEAIKEAQVGVAKADDVNKQIAELKSSLGGEIDKQISANSTIKEIQSNNEALGTRLDDVLKISNKGVEDAAKAIELLNSNIDIGGSLIALVPGTSTPIWAEKLEKTEEVTPDGEEVYVANDNIGYQSATEKLVKASDKIEYMVSFWHKSSVPGSKMFVQLSFYDEKGDPVNAVKYRKDKTEKDDGSVHWYKRSQTYVINGLQGETEWAKHEYVIGLRPGTEFVFLKGLWWNHDSAPAKAAQYLGGFRIDPLIPSQADVDRAQNKAIEANSLALEQQKAINKANEEFKSLQTDFNSSQIKLNKTYNAMWDAQGKRNLLQEGIDAAQTKAIKSLSKMDAGTSLIAYYEPSDADVQSGKARYDLPEWGEYIADKRYESADGYPGLPPGEDFAYGASSSTGTKVGYLSYRPVIPETTYTLRFWAKGSGNLVIYMYGDGNTHPITSVRQLKVNQKTLEEVRDKEGKRIYEPNGNGNMISSKGFVRLLNGFVFPEEWTYFSYEVNFLASTRNVRLAHFYWNWRISSTNGQYFSGMTFTPDIPSQAQIDQAQNEAIKANTLALENQKDINDKQKGIAAAHAKAIDSNRKAIRSLAKIDLGGSLLAYMPLTDKEIENGITREYLPAWAANATNVLNGSGTGRGYSFLGSKGGSAKGGEVYAQVSQGTQYLLDIEMSSSESFLPTIFFKTSNSGIKSPIKRYYWTEKNKYGGLETTTYIDDTDSIALLPTGERTSILVDFQDDVEDICVERLEWLYANSITVKRFTFAPYTPPQAAIDAQQNNVMNKLKAALEFEQETTKRLQGLTAEIASMAVSHIFVDNDRKRYNTLHNVGVAMPSLDRKLKLYAHPDFDGNITSVVNMSGGKSYSYNSYFAGKSTVEVSRYDSFFKPISKNGGIKRVEVSVPIGNVDNVFIIIDPFDWSNT